MIREAIDSLVEGQSLSTVQAAQAMDEIMSGEATSAQFGAFVTALRLKGETSDEIAGMAKVMRDRSLKVEIDDPLVDTCGTGGDLSSTFNISTTAGFVVAGAGAIVAKHGNRAMSGSCGSADVLEALGVKIDLSPGSVQRCLQKIGFGFMFAQRYHPSMRFAAAPRREIGIRTVFNVLGPLTNPANAKSHLIGVADTSMAKKMAKVLGKLGSTRALVVHGNDGLDEITLGDDTQVWDMKHGEVHTYTISPEDLGFARVGMSQIKAESIEQSTRILHDVLDGKPGPARDVVVANAAAALVVCDRAQCLQEGVQLAAESIDNGKALDKLNGLIELSRDLE